MDGASTSGGAQDFHNLALDHGRSDYDQRQNMVAAITWNTSYYKGTNGLMRQVLNGWMLSPIVTLGSGLPLTVTSGKDNNYDGVSNDRADVTGNPFLDAHRSRADVTQMWFNTAAFAPNAIGKDGNSARNLVDAPGFRNVDLGLFRNFAVHEKVNMQFRAEFTNFLNLVSLGNPNGAYCTPGVTCNFGKITGAREMRQLQLGLRFAY
jgi:hypothetical protein